MTTETTSAIDKIEVIDGGIVQVRVRYSETEDGVEIGTKFHRYAIIPGDDFSNEDASVQSVCQAAHTQEVIEAYKASAFTIPTLGV